MDLLIYIFIYLGFTKGGQTYRPNTSWRTSRCNSISDRKQRYWIKVKEEKFGKLSLSFLTFLLTLNYLQWPVSNWIIFYFPFSVFFEHIWPSMTSPDLCKWSLTIIYNYCPLYLNDSLIFLGFFTSIVYRLPFIVSSRHWPHFIVFNH